MLSVMLYFARQQPNSQNRMQNVELTLGDMYQYMHPVLCSEICAANRMQKAYMCIKHALH